MSRTARLPVRLSLLMAVPMAATFFGGVASATPITIDFSSGSYSTVAPGTDNVYVEGGFTFFTPPGTITHFDSGPNGPLLGACCADVLVFHEAEFNAFDNMITLDFGGAAFDIFSFDLVLDSGILGFNPAINPVMTVTASDGRTLATPSGASPGFTGTVDLNWLSVTSVTFNIVTNSGSAGNVLMDNVRTDNDPSLVPEPSTLSLLLFALLASGGCFRRQNRAKKP